MIRHSLASACLVGAVLGCAEAPAAPVRSVHPAAEQYDAMELRPGDCIEPFPEDFAVTVVPCTVPHAAEFATTYVVPDGPWPGMKELGRVTQSGCGPRMRYVPERKDEVKVAGLVPSEEDWPKRRTVYCLAVPAAGGKLVGRVIL
ncbi:hypothetical protein ETD86_11785 [Nonomuraea turkmeniaca]|uniref:Septum formation-related domain-containing protein n=1 Tax=Nonomuraea turkmeniaca TaxID=103838 RepID=A0A5S4FNU3_9ACTN|nr:hypothetical protein [Nonomuraea turkmeniaca]TMR22373.1 hypothetical protein ETD86_11785 [Nonomuraea turkmeniaca]